MTDDLAQGTAHPVGDDLAATLRADPAITTLWQGLTPLGRNEFLCWIEDAKQPATRQRRIARTIEELAEGKRRPCCWPGCIHRTDKAPGKWQQAVLVEGKGGSEAKAVGEAGASHKNSVRPERGRGAGHGRLI